MKYLEMICWQHITLLFTLAGILVLLLILLLQHFFQRQTATDVVLADSEIVPNFRSRSARLHPVSPQSLILDTDDSRKINGPVVHEGVPMGRLFSWDDHPSLVADAVENGWQRFAFTTFTSSPSVKSAKCLRGSFAASDYGNEVNVEISWEVREGSADSMQKIRLNPGLEEIVTSPNSSLGAAAVIRTALPLPGPKLENISSFPQEAYFEITILPANEDINKKLSDKENNEKSGEDIKVIEGDYYTKNDLDTPIRVTSGHCQKRNKTEEMKLGKKQVGKNKIILLSVGLTARGPLPLKIPGSYPGSVGFNSSGSVYLHGIKLVFESEKDEWGRAEKVIGCGYNPSQRKVFFTVDSQLAYEIHCKSEEFGSPLYPTLAANTDTTVLVNLGQSPFKFAPVNMQRTPNPCFITPLANSPALLHEDSNELFSMRRIDSPRTDVRSHDNTVNSIKDIEFDRESEGELFEIVLDRTGRCPQT